MLEGSPTDVFQPQWIRQGDPLSLLLFIIVLDYLIRLTKKVVTDKHLEVCTNEGAAVEPIIAFANDMTFFSRASYKSLKTISEILDEFCSFSGLQVNATKSLVIFSKKVNDKE